MAKTEVALWKAGFFQPIRVFESFLNFLIGWIKAGLSKRPLLFWTCERAKVIVKQSLTTKVTL